MDIVLKKDSFKEVHKQVLPIMEKHFNEISFYSTGTKFKPDLEKYFFYEENNVLIFFTASSASRIVGYCAYIVHRHCHCDMIQGYQDVFYVDPEFRKHGIGSKLIDFADKYLKDFGCNSVFTSVNVEHDFGKLYEKKNYKLIEKQYARWL